MLLKIVKVREVETPQHAHPNDAGIDFFSPIDTIIKPGANALIPSGIKIEVPPGYMGLFLNKSGVASKKELLIGAQVIDFGYSGEVHIDLHNVGSKDVEIKVGMKLAQLVIIPVLCCDISECDEDDLYYSFKEDKQRGEGGFGSTGV